MLHVNRIYICLYVSYIDLERKYEYKFFKGIKK